MLRQCRYCQKSFTPTKYNPRQKVCGSKSCQRQRQYENRRALLARDPEYQQVCKDAQQKWRQREGAAYMRRYRKRQSAYRKGNVTRQQARDGQRRLQNLVKNNSAFDLKVAAEAAYLVVPPGEYDLVKNNLARSKALVINVVSVGGPAVGSVL